MHAKPPSPKVKNLGGQREYYIYNKTDKEIAGLVLVDKNCFSNGYSFAKHELKIGYLHAWRWTFPFRFQFPPFIWLGSCIQGPYVSKRSLCCQQFPHYRLF